MLLQNPAFFFRALEKIVPVRKILHYSVYQGRRQLLAFCPLSGGALHTVMSVENATT